MAGDGGGGFQFGMEGTCLDVVASDACEAGGIARGEGAEVSEVATERETALDRGSGAIDESCAGAVDHPVAIEGHVGKARAISQGEDAGYAQAVDSDRAARVHGEDAAGGGGQGASAQRAGHFEVAAIDEGRTGVPACIRVGPVYVLAPETTRMPVLTLVRPPAPERTPEICGRMRQRTVLVQALASGGPG